MDGEIAWLLVAASVLISCGSAAPTRQTIPPSCSNTAAASRCGPAGESCCLTLPVPGGSFDRTYTNEGTGPSGGADPARVSAFRLDKYLVTVGRFRAFVAARHDGWMPEAGAGKHVHLNAGRGLLDGGLGQFESGWSLDDTVWLPVTAGDWSTHLACDPVFATWTDEPGPQESLPVNCVDWYDAYAFCIWDGGFLPSEAEWGYAAAGGGELRPYPWGASNHDWDSRYVIANCNFPPGASGCTGVVDIAPAGTAALGAGRWGQVDLAGELAEWTLDWFAPFANPCIDCVFLTDFSYRLIRGGSFGTDTEETFAFARDGDVPSSRNAFYGFRCARGPD
jgi:sulfatase modifying factor 1